MLFALAGCLPASARTPPAAVPVPAPLSQADIDYFANHELMVPVDGVVAEALRDSFNEARSGGRFHRAIDILAPRETPVVAAASGRVIKLRQNAAGGITAYLVDAEGRYMYYYAHLARYSDEITEGLEVKQGFMIGFVGTSGNAPPDTPHLHFQAMRLADGQKDWWNGRPVDVRRFMTKRGQVLQ